MRTFRDCVYIVIDLNSLFNFVCSKDLNEFYETKLKNNFRKKDLRQLN